VLLTFVGGPPVTAFERTFAAALTANIVTSPCARVTLAPSEGTTARIRGTTSLGPHRGDSLEGWLVESTPPCAPLLQATGVRRAVDRLDSPIAGHYSRGDRLHWGACHTPTVTSAGVWRASEAFVAHRPPAGGAMAAAVAEVRNQCELYIPARLRPGL